MLIYLYLIIQLEEKLLTFLNIHIYIYSSRIFYRSYFHTGKITASTTNVLSRGHLTS